MKSGLGIIYKWGIVLFLLVGLGMLIVEPPLGLFMIVIAFALFGAQKSRERRWTEERRHQEMMQAMQDK